MRCHFITDDIAGNVLIPGCWPAANHGDIDFCTCRTYTYRDFEKEKYREVVKEKDEEIELFQSEIDRLNRIIEQIKTKTDEYRSH